jgi:hypothetical protein
VSGLTKKHGQPDLGSTQLMVASRARSKAPAGTGELATQHDELVAQDEDLQILGSSAAAERGEQLDRAA